MVGKLHTSTSRFRLSIYRDLTSTADDSCSNSFDDNDSAPPPGPPPGQYGGYQPQPRFVPLTFPGFYPHPR